jgi:hypothetical protein
MLGILNWFSLNSHNCSYLAAPFYLFIFCRTGVWTQGVVLARQALYYLSYIPVLVSPILMRKLIGWGLHS